MLCSSIWKLNWLTISITLTIKTKSNFINVQLNVENKRLNDFAGILKNSFILIIAGQKIKKRLHIRLQQYFRYFLNWLLHLKQQPLPTN